MDRLKPLSTANHIEMSGRVRVAAPVAKALMFFTPEGERRWVPGWQPEYLHPRDGALDIGLAFRTHHHGELTLWLVSRCDRAAGTIEYVRLTPDSRMGTVSIRCVATDAGDTETTVTYRLTALSAAGEATLNAFAGGFESMLASWEASIAACLHAGMVADGTPRLELFRGDITTLHVDAIVNAANEGMFGGGGVDGAVHRAAGPALLAACRSVPEVRPAVRCPTGEARLTPGFRLSAQYVIHTAGPVWKGGGHGESELLARCYRNSLALAREQEFTSIAFAAISCGVYGFPAADAARIAVREARASLDGDARLQRIVLVAFDGESENALRAALEEELV